jgi:mono/diheme cytochrome c family protein
MFRLFFLFLIPSIVHAENRPSITLPSTTQQSFANTEKITIKKDPVYQTEKHYQAFSLMPILKKLSMGYKKTVNDSLIIFTAKDGYKVTMSYSDALKEKGYIAFRDLAANNDSWLKFKFGNEYITPAPFYLVWPKPDLDKWRYPFPFQLTTISLQSIESYYSGAAPQSKNNQIKEGFTLFSRYCIGCHSVNHVGGNLGPELNYPKNITDYYNSEKLTDFILDASSVNKNTKMPVFNKILNHHQALSIQTYLRSMKSVKPIQLSHPEEP